jgi:DMSO/TMAO reductase YedYZ heme-binding membrane subunit/nitrite reductase/ring-hydroxylating ferredoxin subunit
MSAGFRFISWTPYKRRYDLAMAGIVLTYVCGFFVAGKLAWRGEHAISDEILVARALGTCGFLMLNFILCIGPLARLSPRFLPLLYNRRHLGVATFFVGLLHGGLVLGFYHGFGVINPLDSLLTSSTQYRSVSAFPFEILGLVALLILLLMAATSHDFWLKTLSPAVWKSLHMLVYVAWALLVLHVALGALQSERNPIYAILLGLVVVTVCGLHIVAATRERRRDRIVGKDWIEVPGAEQIRESRAVVICQRDRERIAVYKHKGQLHAVSNVCAHQGGPLGEGRIIDGCITCPWHGYQYRPEDGCAPPPFTEKLPTYRLRVESGKAMLQLEPLPPGTATEGIALEPEASHVG